MLFPLAPALALVQPAAKPVDLHTARLAGEKAITQDILRDYLTFIASDALQGRDTPSPGLDAAAQFLAFNLKRFGVKPGGDNGTYFQKIPMVKNGVDEAKTSITVGEKTLRYGEGFAIDRGNGSATGALVFIEKELGTTDVKGKVVLLSAEAESSPTDALQAGAVAVLKGATGQAWSRRAMLMSRRGGGGWRMERSPTPEPAVAPPVLSVSPDVFTSLKESAGKDITVSAATKIDRVFTQNVVGIVEGADPKLKSEFVAIGAHYDHVGMGTGPGDVIFNGADDDGSGTVAVLAIADAAVKARPKRSLIFVWHAGEEKGLWGSDYFTDSPTVPIGQIIAQLNIDMIGRSRLPGDNKPANRSLTGPDAIYVIGTTMMSTELGKLIHSTNQQYLKLTYDPQYDSPTDPNRFFFRSDHYNYARKGIPICFWFDGVHEDYHQVGDEVSKIDFAKIEKIARTVFLTAVNVANLPQRPKVDKPLNR